MVSLPIGLDCRWIGGERPRRLLTTLTLQPPLLRSGRGRAWLCVTGRWGRSGDGAGEVCGSLRRDGEGHVATGVCGRGSDDGGQPGQDPVGTPPLPRPAHHAVGATWGWLYQNTGSHANGVRTHFLSSAVLRGL